ncbi:2-succinyl-5-enolpyruvyl-6-hydroxy-3-cyclohexene-1-carboxylic-acid synthase [Corynebacterium freneyi]|uniref:2-succinyl-5-enolpyruvyl-6-hydroxy-3- cyclohexene-1-carboxylic-acid synthase n=1 Tax=Corynebacterium freneyi TaxID=134034 RepID=UPI00255090F9|nr:2-succinyl-5-enolpyruvyl-6-hydroxy-3-cyclohexene-1-carboxylic-acid synthase [Corynebacterium freneyi]MDK8768039.1 2-succinyl-5-enolpyruvyl-6-hydroxy-3-cyclohexene-1-carboxylic-acid synthase [Corynebacterium freneyi]
MDGNGNDGNAAANSPAAPSEVVAGLIVDELIRCGTREAVVCPGSRSAPLARALLSAERAGRLRLHVRPDERSAGFLALGLAAATGTVTPVVVTSGTAVANLLPAMVEATYSGVPLMALTADRPASYRGTGANQTIVQDRLFADASVCEVDVDGTTPVSDSGAAALRARVDRIVAAALATGRGGAVHLNVRLVEPLVPDEERLPDLPAGRGEGPWTELRHLHGGRAGHRAVVKLDVSRKTLVIAGSGAPDVPELAQVPTIAEPNAPAPETPVHPLAAATFGRDDCRPDQIVVLGRPTLHRGVARLLADPRIDVTVVADGDDYPDVSANARRVVAGVDVVGECGDEWLEICEAASELAAAAVRDVVSAHEPLTGLHVAAAVADSLRTGEQLVLGASNPVRDASWAGLPFPGVDVHAGRGAAGIDGTVATAIGIALARDRAHADEIRPPRTIALMGDLTFLHDAGALLIGPGEPRPESLTIVVANDSGGGIFETLEAGAPALRGSFERIFGTPQAVDIAALCDAYGVGHEEVADLRDLLAVLHPDTDVDGIRVVEVATSRAGRRELHDELTRKAALG